MMRIEFQYTLEDVAEGIAPQLGAGQKRFSASWILRRVAQWGFGGMFVVILAVLTSDALRNTKDAEVSELSTTVYPALFPAAYVLLLLVWSGWTAWLKTRPAGRALVLNPTARPPSLRILGIAVGLIIGIFAGQAMFSVISQEHSAFLKLPRSQLLWLEYGIWLIDFVLLRILAALHRRWAPKQQWIANPSWQRAKTIEMDEERFCTFDAVSRMESAWSCFAHVRETEHLFVLQAESGLRYLVPKRGFGEREDLTRVRVLLQNAVADSKFLVPATGFSVLPKATIAAENPA